MRPLRVDPDALRLLAVRCRTWAADLAAPAPPEVVPMPATGAAVANVYAELGTAAGALAARMQEYADLLDEAAGRYRDGDSRSASALAAFVMRT